MLSKLRENANNQSEILPSYDGFLAMNGYLKPNISSMICLSLSSISGIILQMWHEDVEIKFVLQINDVSI